MPVTFTVDPYKQPVESLTSLLESQTKSSAKEYIKSICFEHPKQSEICQEVLQSSFGGDALGRSPKDLAKMMKINSGGLVDVSRFAYNRHHHLVLRPDDIWISILSQLSFYINAHADELRSIFVNHEEKKDLKVILPGGLYSSGYAGMAQVMTSLLHENIKDPELRDWIMAQFSTTTDVDRTIYAIEMMATMKKYFNYKGYIVCGLPGVTLEGTKADWENLLTRIDKLESYGSETKAWAAMLRPVLTRFVRSFDLFEEGSESKEAEKKELRNFWNSIAHYSGGGSGPTWLSGWITAFCPWTNEGQWIDSTCLPETPIPEVPKPTKFPKKAVKKNKAEMDIANPEEIRSTGASLVLDGVMYPIVDIVLVPEGRVEVDVKIYDDNVEYDTVMVAGHLGGKVLEPRKEGGDGNKIAPAAGWAIYLKDKAVEEKIQAESRAL